MVTTVRRYNGNTWQDATVRRWDGSAWLDVYPPISPVPHVVGTATGGASAWSDAQFTVSLPSGAASYLAVVTVNYGGATPPNGWSLVANLGDDRYQLYRSTSTNPGTSWRGNGPVAAIVIGYDTPTIVSTPTVSSSQTSPSVQAPGPALVLRGVGDLNDSTSPIGYPALATEGRVQRVQPEPDGAAWVASVAAASHEVTGGGPTGTATWTVPASWQPTAWTALLTIA